jgi:competence ComEA-like helix-hairpin-helix protein
MLRLILLFCIALLALTAAENDGLPEGEGKEIFVRMCSNCHALKQVTRKTYPRKFWESVVDDMVSRGAEGTEDEANIVTSYLSRNFGKAVNINQATAKEIQAGLSFTAPQSEIIVKYRTESGPLKSFEDLQKIQGLNAKRLDEQKKNIVF